MDRQDGDGSRRSRARLEVRPASRLPANADSYFANLVEHVGDE